VVRAWVARQQPVREVEFPAARLAEASELFLTNSRLGVMPVHFGTIAPGPVGRILREAILREKLVP
jgi:branched-subunit amino acid aminotransferase/4-amino-4-deoxychorismate lyase